MRWLLGAAMIATMLAGLVIAARRAPGRLIAPLRRHRFVPWSGAEVAAAVVLYVALPSLAIIALESTGLLDKAESIHKLSGESLYRRLWASALVAPWFVPAILLLLWYGSQTK